MHDLTALTLCFKLKVFYVNFLISVNAYKYYLSNRICDIWNASPNIVFEVSSSNNFRRLLDQVKGKLSFSLQCCCNSMFCVGHV